MWEGRKGESKTGERNEKWGLRETKWERPEKTSSVRERDRDEEKSWDIKGDSEKDRTRKRCKHSLWSKRDTCLCTLGCQSHRSLLPLQLDRYPKQERAAAIWPKYSIRLRNGFPPTLYYKEQIVSVWGCLGGRFNYQTAWIIITLNISLLLISHGFIHLCFLNISVTHMKYTWSEIVQCFCNRSRIFCTVMIIMQITAEWADVI